MSKLHGIVWNLARSFFKIKDCIQKFNFFFFIFRILLITVEFSIGLLFLRVPRVLQNVFQNLMKLVIGALEIVVAIVFSLLLINCVLIIMFAMGSERNSWIIQWWFQRGHKSESLRENCKWDNLPFWKLLYFDKEKNPIAENQTIPYPMS